MKTKYLLLTVILSLLFSCEKAPSADIWGDQPVDEEQLDSLPSIILRAAATADNSVKVNLSRSGDLTSIKIYAEASIPLEVSQSMNLLVDESLVNKYNTRNRTKLTLLPAAYYTISNEGIIDIPTGAEKSEESSITINTVYQQGDTLGTGSYLLPLKLNSENLKLSSKALYIIVDCEKQFTEKGKLLNDGEAFFVFYLNTEDYDPRLITDYYIDKHDSETWNLIWTKTIGNIVNLKQSTLSFDFSSNSIALKLHKDLRYVLERYSTYIKPLQDNGRKVCLCIQGGNTGYGFCNLTDEQISDFVSQIKILLEQYPLDGINLWDINSGYARAGAPAVNTTSYPKLIVSLREALGENKLLTITDYGDPTSSFWSTDLTGGIEVGRYLDYAWSGYNYRSDGYQIVDPYHQNQPMVSKLYPRRAIRGLAPEKYGCINSPWMDPKSGDFSGTNVRNWVSNGLNYNKILVFEDTRTQLQDNIEGIWAMSMPELLTDLNPQYHYEFSNIELSTYETGGAGYNKWVKNW